MTERKTNQNQVKNTNNDRINITNRNIYVLEC